MIAILSVLLMLATKNVFGITANEARGWHYGNVSSWAEDELVDAVVNGT